MASKNGKVDWYANDVLLAVEGATDEILTQLAFQGEALAKTNAPSGPPGLDTGFMRNAIYAIPAGGDAKETGWPSGQYKSNTTGQMVQRDRVGPPDVPDHTAAIHAAAEYTIYWEIKREFLYKALLELRKIAPGVIKEVGRAKL